MNSPKSERHQLSKSTFIYGCQCTKRLWLHKFKPDVRDEEDPAQTAIFQSGADVGLLARDFFLDGVNKKVASNNFKYGIEEEETKTKSGLTEAF